MTSGGGLSLRWLALALALLAALADDAHAQQRVSATLQVEAGRVYVGQPFQAAVIVTGPDEVSEPDVSAWRAQGLTVEARGTQTFMSSEIINGRMAQTRRVLYNYAVTAFEPGVVVLPPVTVSAGGQTYSTDRAAVEVREPEEVEEFHLRLEVEDDTLYVGQATRVRLTWYVGLEPRGVSFSLRGDRDAFELLSPPETEVIREARRQGRLFGINLSGSEAQAVQGQGRLNGARFTTLTIEQVLIPRRAGTLTIGPAIVAGEATFGRSPQRFAVPSEAVTLDVRPLPEQGRPAGFTGLVGDYEVQATATPTQVRVGDPITLTVRVLGPPPIEAIPPLNLNAQESLTRGFKVPTEISTPEVGESVKTFVQTIRAKTADVSEIPAIELPYFDPERGEYIIARSAPIPIVVEETAEVTLEDAFGGDGVGPVGERVRTRTGGLAHNYEGKGALADQGFNLDEMVFSARGAALMAAPAGVFALAAIGGAIRRRAAMVRTDRRETTSERLRRIDAARGTSGEIAAAMSDAVRDEAAAACDLDTGARLTAGEVGEALRARGIPRGAEVERLLRRCDEVRFGGARDGDVEALRAEAKGLVQAIGAGRGQA